MIKSKENEMNKDQIMNMNPHMFLSIINMKLRDQYDSLASFCDDVDLNIELIKERLNQIGYHYEESLNQFK